MIRTLQGFDLNHEIKEINDLHRGIADKLKSSVEDAIEIGRLLTVVKNNLKHGDFLPWMQVNCSFGKSTAYNYIKLFEHRNKLPSVGNLQEAYQQIETLEAQEKQSEAKKQRERVLTYNQTGEKPEGWKRGTDDKAAEKLKEEEEARARRVEEAKKRLAEEAEYKRRRDEAFQNSKTGIDTDELLDQANEMIQQMKRHEHLNLSGYAENMSQQEMFAAIERYINSFDDVSRQLEATHNLIKKLKMVVTDLQQKSVQGGAA